MAVQALGTSKPGGKDSVGPAGASGRRELTEHPTSSPPQPLVLLTAAQLTAHLHEGPPSHDLEVAAGLGGGGLPSQLPSDEHA